MGGAAPGFGAFEKNLRMPFFLVNCRVSSSEGTEESSEESSSLMDVELWVLVVFLMMGGVRLRRLKGKSQESSKWTQPAPGFIIGLSSKGFLSRKLPYSRSR